MYDLWFTLGTAAMDHGLPNDLLSTITAAGPKFTALAKRELREYIGASVNPLLPITTNTTTAGLLDPAKTNDVRKAIAKYLAANHEAPPISVYTAGRMSQFMAVPIIKFPAFVATAKASFTQALAGALAAQPGGVLSPKFPALLGSIMVDSSLTDRLQQNPANAETKLVKDEFRLPAGALDWDVAQRLANDLNFITARNNFMDAGWPAGCPGEQLESWRNERGIL